MYVTGSTELFILLAILKTGGNISYRCCVFTERTLKVTSYFGGTSVLSSAYKIFFSK
jgi:hypothetical protein